MSTSSVSEHFGRYWCAEISTTIREFIDFVKTVTCQDPSGQDSLSLRKFLVDLHHLLPKPSEVTPEFLREGMEKYPWILKKQREAGWLDEDKMQIYKDLYTYVTEGIEVINSAISQTVGDPFLTSKSLRLIFDLDRVKMMTMTMTKSRVSRQFPCLR